MHLGLVGHQLGQGTPEPDRLRREVSPAAVARVEDQIHDREHGGKAVGEQVGGRHPKGNTGGLDLGLCPHEPLGHGRLGDEEGARDLLGPEPTQRPQRERHLGIECEGGMAAREDELEPLVRNRGLVHEVLAGFRHLEQTGLGRKRAIAADAVDRAVARGRHQPGPRVGGRPVAWPALRGHRERFLGGLLGEVEVAEKADHAGQDATPLVAEDLLEERYRSTTGRTSTAPPIPAAGMRDASSMAASMSSASNTR